MAQVVRTTEVKGEGKGEDFKFDSWHFPLNNSLPFVNQEQLNKRLYKISLPAYACHSEQRVPKRANGTTKPKTTWDKGKIQQQALTLPSKNPVKFSPIAASQVPASLLIQPNTAFGSSVHLHTLPKERKYLK